MTKGFYKDIISFQLMNLKIWSMVMNEILLKLWELLEEDMFTIF